MAALNDPAPERNAATAVAGTAPRVSVVLATHRLDPFFPAGFASILDQTFHDFEFLIVLQVGLRDRRDEILAMCRHDPRVRLLEVPALGGLGLALNIGIGEARGEYIARMDGDDLSLPDRLEAQTAFLDAHPDVAVVGGRLQLIDEHSQVLAKPYPFYGTDAEIRRILPLRNPMPHPAVMMRRSVLMELGGYKYGHVSEDYELFLRMARNPAWHFANLDKLVLQYRRHSAQLTNDEYLKQRFADLSGLLLTETLRSRSPRYLLGALAVHPWVRAIREKLQGR